MTKQKDNSTFAQKVRLRRVALAAAVEGPILETHVGYGRIGERLYLERCGVAIDKKLTACEHVATTRPHWRIYQGECEKVLASGLAADLPFALVDLDPYGNPFDVIDSILSPGRRLADPLQLVVNDGARQTVRIGGAWHMRQMASIVQTLGNDLFGRYLEVAQLLIKAKAALIGRRVTHFEGYYCGASSDMTHYWATLAA